MLIKIIGVCVIIISTSCMGFVLSNKLKNRHTELGNINYAIDLLETEISYLLTPLPKALIKISNNISGNISRLLHSVGDKSAIKDGRTFYEIWSECIKEQKQTMSLKNDDLQIIDDFGRTLGTMDIDGQLSQIKMVRCGIERKLVEAQNDIDKYSKLYKGMGILGGIFIALILF